MTVKKKSNRLVCLALSVIMITVLVPSGVFADEHETQAEAYTESLHSEKGDATEQMQNVETEPESADKALDYVDGETYARLDESISFDENTLDDSLSTETITDEKITDNALPEPGIAEAAGFSPRTTAPNTGIMYYGNSNPLIGSYGWCTWYAWGRAWEILGSRPYLSIHAANAWYNETTAYPKSSNYYAAKVGAVACYKNHVAIVEAVGSNGAPSAVSEAGFTSSKLSGDYGGNIQYITTKTSGGKKYNLHFHYGMDTSRSQFVGYIYILGDSPPPSVHSHSWSTGYESAHPHKIYRKCSSCGAVEYTGGTQLVSGCSSCYPVGSVSLTRSFNRTGRTAEFYRNNVSNATDYTLTLYRNGSLYNSYSMTGGTYWVSGLPSGVYTAELTARNRSTSQTRGGGCQAFTIVDSYPVNYNANGGENAPAAQTKIQNENMSITSSIPTKRVIFSRAGLQAKPRPRRSINLVTYTRKILRSRFTQFGSPRHT